MKAGLDDERFAAAEAIEDVPYADPWLWERNAAPGCASSEPVCIRHAASSDVLVLIVGGALSDIVRKEYLAAKEAGAQLCIFIKCEAQLPQDVLDFISAERDLCITKDFRTIEDLRTGVLAALNQHAVWSARKGQASRRQERNHADQRNAWQLNEEAIRHVQRGEEARARDCLSQMEKIGQRLGDQHILSTVRQNLGARAHEAGQFEAASEHYVEAVRQKLAIHDDLGVLQILLNLAGLMEQLGRLSEAEHLLGSLRNVLQSSGHPELLAGLYNNFGKIAARHGDLRNAEMYFSRSIRFARESGAQEGEVIGLRNMGLLRVEQRRLKAALGWFRRAVDEAQGGELYPQVQALHRHLAATFHALSRGEEAEVELERVRVEALRLGDASDVALSTLELGALAIERGDYNRAVRLLRDARDLYASLQDSIQFVAASHRLLLAASVVGDHVLCDELARDMVGRIPHGAHRERGEVYKRVAIAHLTGGGDGRAARAHLQRALGQFVHCSDDAAQEERLQAAALLRQHGAPQFALPFLESALEASATNEEARMLFRIRNDRGCTLDRVGRSVEAYDDFAACLAIAQDLSDPVLEATALLNLGELERRKGALDAAIGHLESAVVLSLRLGCAADGFLALSNLGLAFLNSGRISESERTYRTLRDRARYCKDERQELIALTGLGDAARGRGHFRRAARAYQSAAALGLRLGNLGGWFASTGNVLECYSSAGDELATQTIGQEIIDRLPEAVSGTHGESNLWLAFARAGRSWAARGEIRSAAVLYAVAAGVSVEFTSDHEHAIENVMKPLAFMAIVTEREMAEGAVDLYEETTRALCAHLGVDEAWAGEMITASQQAARAAS